MYSGHVPMSWEKNDQGSLFFWLAKHRKTDDAELAGGAEKLIVWLNGGPGFSSMFGMMHENGPFTIEFIDFYMTAKGKGSTTDEQMLAVDFRHFILLFLEVLISVQRYVVGNSIHRFVISV